MKNISVVVWASSEVQWPFFATPVVLNINGWEIIYSNGEWRRMGDPSVLPGGLDRLLDKLL